MLKRKIYPLSTIIKEPSL